MAADATRLPQGIIISGTTATARPVGTIIYVVAENAFYISLSASTPLYQSVGPGIANTSPTVRSDPGTGVALNVTTSAAYTFTTNGAETNTLAIPTFVGQEMLLTLGTDTMGARVITVASAINVAGNTIMTFTEVNDSIKLEAYQLAAALAWRVVANDGVALS